MESSLPSDSILEEDGLRVHYFCLLFSSGCFSFTFFVGIVVVRTYQFFSSDSREVFPAAIPGKRFLFVGSE
jgi:hypothetical protein